MTKSDSIYTLNFGLVCLSSLFFSASFNMLIPELPTYLSGLGGEKYIGLIIALFTLTAGISRPFSGKLTDSVGRKPVILIGAAVCVLCGFLYPILTSVAGFLFLRLLHGFSTGFSPTAIAAYVSDIIPAKKWGEALGVQSLSFSLGLALGPAIGSSIKLYYSFDVLFYSSSLMALLSIVLVSRLKETFPTKQKFSSSILKLKSNEIIAKEALPPALVTLLSFLSFGIILTLIPVWTNHLGAVNKGLFFVVFTIASLFVRLIAGKLSDKYSRTLVINIGLVFLFISLILMGLLQTLSGLMIGAVVYGLGMGMVSPSLNAWTVDLSNPETKGKAIATMFIALEIGIGGGALLSGWYYQNDISRIPVIFYACSVMIFSALFYVIVVYRKR
ncbi:arabinose efflux permease family protein [Bernardetia litoralis DSM 6794]|uniref:Arabinose efflux permease family protein n=1 Tax=Bernardetia litoralis (strain ATCC 23117 / DSM 6794 / NBRC 15988 / NCIMB 1366 / Fx l1 / Sio-4) TaxID=880071 RepID=I4AMU0_BERLS|nr:MFS transporter [Bernardetia litoralis]AFM05275.1 arabinose efflux permease family protein [Bernardetia litoralis DSM 6794]